MDWILYRVVGDVMKSDMTTLYNPPYLYVIGISDIFACDHAYVFEMGIDLLYKPDDVYIGTTRFFKTTQLLKMYTYMTGVKRWRSSSDIWEGIL